jgi:hypothetical protein
MKKIFLIVAIIACSTSIAQTANFSGYTYAGPMADIGEGVGNEKGIMVDRPSTDIEYSEIGIIFDNESLISAVALTRLDGRIELISANRKNRGQLIGAYSSIRGDISLNLDSFKDKSETTYILNIVKNLKTIVAIFFKLEY